MGCSPRGAICDILAGRRMPEGPVAVVVLSWNRGEDTLACLRSLAAVSEPTVTTILVDNASTDGTVEAVRGEFPEVEVVVNGSNLGFAEGNNAGIRHALDGGAAWVLILNNDVEVDPGFLQALLEEAARRPDVGALSPLILFGPPSETIWFAGAAYDPRKGYNGRQRGYGAPAGAPFDEVWETDRICGAAMLVPRAVLEEVGDFDTELFAYYEDTDWSLRARAAGHRLYIVPAGRIWHKVSRSSGGESSPATLYYGTRNALAVSERYAPLRFVGTWRRRGVLLTAHCVQALGSGGRREGLGAVLAGFRDFRAGRFGRRE
jgi:GT2 family glycosyltransferase